MSHSNNTFLHDYPPHKSAIVNSTVLLIIAIVPCPANPKFSNLMFASPKLLIYESKKVKKPLKDNPYFYSH